MKKALSVLVFILSVSVLSVTAQPDFSFSVHGGYTWLLGVAGADIQYGRFAIGGGWMPTKMPMSQESIQAFCGSLTYYQPVPVLKGLSAYISAGGATNGYRYEDSWGGSSTSPIMIATAGLKYDLWRFWLRTGAGYGWCKESGAFAFEACLGFKIIARE